MSTVKHLSYAGITLPLPTPQLERGWLAAIQNPYDFLYTEFWNFDSPLPASLPTPSIPIPPSFRLNQLYWPTGASRPAWFSCVVEASRYTEIKTALGLTNIAAPLVMYDGRTGKTITAAMRLVGEHPINVTVGEETQQFFLLTLTDDRFFWYGRRGVIEQPASWGDLYEQISAIIGVTINNETVPSEYATPSSKWVTAYGSTPALLDAVAAQVGQRVVVALDGTVRTVSWETAKAESDAYFAAADPVVSGGQIPVTDIARWVPEQVTTVFGKLEFGVLTDPPYTVDRTLVSLAIPAYGAATGVSGDADVIYADLPYTGSNTSEVDDYADRASFDYYGWLLVNADAAFPGIEPWVPTGWEDFCEWTLTIDGSGSPFSITRVRRGPWKSFLGGTFTSGLIDPLTLGCGSGLLPGCAPQEGTGSGSGSGSGGGGSGSGSGGTPNGPTYCDERILVAFATTSGGVQTLTVSEIDVAVSNGRLKIVECDTQEFNLGPHSPTRPSGFTLPVATKVCLLTEEIQYLDWDSEPQSKNVVVGAVLERRLITVPIADVTGCINASLLDCCPDGSGSGSGGEWCTEGDCTDDCDQCQFPTEMSVVWHIYINDELVASVCHVPASESGNSCLWLSSDLSWEMFYNNEIGVWTLKNYDDGRVWATVLFDCCNENTFSTGDVGGVDAVVRPNTPSSVCCPGGIRYDCIDGECIEDPAGPYTNIDDCNAACCAVPAVGGVCCEDLPATLVAALAVTCEGLISDNYTLTFNAMNNNWVYNNFESGPGVKTITFSCLSGIWFFVVSAVCANGVDLTGFTITNTVECCSPFLFEGTTTSWSGSCCNGDIASVSVTPA